ncbi:hypothetical protein, partial [Acetobacter papayae]|uniref:hypothetical protein n=1 Tax=Acetobacter papayae TaxID=1076592 RepID=UPI001F165C20
MNAHRLFPRPPAALSPTIRRQARASTRCPIQRPGRSFALLRAVLLPALLCAGAGATFPHSPAQAAAANTAHKPHHAHHTTPHTSASPSGSHSVVQARH